MSLTLVTHLAAAVVAAAGVWAFQGARMDSAVADVRLEMSAANVKATSEKLQAVKEARAEERAINKTYVEALNAARTREIALRRDRDLAQSESDGLREQAVSAARRLADAATPTATVREYAVAVNELFDNCQRDYQSMADKAAGHANDVRTLLAAWPVTKPPEIQRMPQQGVGAGSS